jgi:hypothetical protein
LQLSNVPFFSAPEEPECREFVSILFRIPEVDRIEISAATAEIHFDSSGPAREFARKVGVELLALQSETEAMTIPLLKADCKGIIRGPPARDGGLELEGSERPARMYTAEKHSTSWKREPMPSAGT